MKLQFSNKKILPDDAKIVGHHFSNRKKKFNEFLLTILQKKTGIYSMNSNEVLSFIAFQSR